MLEKHFGFSVRPFAPAPQAERWFPTESFEQARQTLVRVIERGEGPALLVGPAGTGKTLLCGVLAAKFSGKCSVAAPSSARLCTRRALLQNILFDLGLPYRNLAEGELRLSLLDHLDSSGSKPRQLLLLVDEAHTLPLRLLEELRLMTNLTSDGRPIVHVVLAGGPGLEERFANPKLDSFQQRLAARCYVHAFGRDETSAYVRWQIESAGGSPGLVTNDALQAAFTATDGIPRLVNQLLDHALFLAAAAGRRRIDGDDIQEAWADLQQLPTPWNATVSGVSDAAAGTDGNPGTSIIEFGELDDEPSLLIGDLRFDEEDFAEVAERDAALRKKTSIDAASVAPPPIDVAPIHNAPTSAGERRELRVARIDEDESQSSSVPPPRIYAPPTTRPEVEVAFPSAINPFGDAFHEEEVVVDRYAETRRPDAAAQRKTDSPSTPNGPPHRSWDWIDAPLSVTGASADAAATTSSVAATSDSHTADAAEIEVAYASPSGFSMIEFAPSPVSEFDAAGDDSENGSRDLAVSDHSIETVNATPCGDSQSLAGSAASCAPHESFDAVACYRDELGEEALLGGSPAQSLLVHDEYSLDPADLAEARWFDLPSTSELPTNAPASAGATLAIMEDPVDRVASSTRLANDAPSLGALGSPGEDSATARKRKTPLSIAGAGSDADELADSGTHVSDDDGDSSPDEQESAIAAQIRRLRNITSAATAHRNADRSAAAHDDRDLLVVADRAVSSARLDEAIEQAGKQSYRQLFARLRQR